ncbi:MAG TPA: hypothetical protein DIS94_10105 [Bacteroidetes bacterium]|nr:hypothetical protein [Bacteroidota bacterium]
MEFLLILLLTVVVFIILCIFDILDRGWDAFKAGFDSPKPKPKVNSNDKEIIINYLIQIRITKKE